MAVLSYMKSPSYRRRYVHFCAFPIAVDDRTPEPILIRCSAGYSKKYRKNKNLELCEHHLKSEIQHRRQSNA